MSIYLNLARKVRAGEPIPIPLALLLSAATPVQRAGMWLRLRGPRQRVDARVISFGNITAGGTGKTPAVIERAQQELAGGHRVAVLTRGYGAQAARTDPLVVPGAEAVTLWRTLGDEPALIAKRAPGVVIARSADRVAAAREAIAHFGCDTLILDDGYQYVRLDRDENVVVIDATKPFGNGHLVPRGILREPVSALKRATHILLTRCDLAPSLEPLLELLGKLCPGAPVRRTVHAPDRLWRVGDGMEIPLGKLASEKVTAVCAIGNPDGFQVTLEDLGAEVVEMRAFRDHADIPPQALVADTLVVATEKDAVRMVDPPENVLALGITLRDAEV